MLIKEICRFKATIISFINQSNPLAVIMMVPLLVMRSGVLELKTFLFWLSAALFSGPNAVKTAAVQHQTADGHSDRKLLQTKQRWC